MTGLYTYRAQCVGVVDGDTIDVVLDCGFHAYRFERLRLLGVNTPELKSKVRLEREAAEKARAWLYGELGAVEGNEGYALISSEAWPLIVRTEKCDSFGRWLATVWCDGVAQSVNDRLLDLELGVVYKRKRK